ncbi:cache domain-containing sensor histidine kinase [Petroclostridium xylanilyticum]|uniref:cache domain-containing sensor histidine kinase n=1 Tax=Petroclostridium xylanilyticum TaxID=1792311 RepID=UPI0018E3EE53|nr:sensor histidine kinase [Petroclostridium xylanilyticum]
MKKIHLRPGLSLKDQLLIYFILIAFIPTSIISIYYYITSKSAVKKSVGDSHYKIISQIMNNIENHVEQANQLTDWIYVDKDIMKLLKRNPTEVDNYDQEKKQVIESIEKQFKYLPVTSYISSFFILGNNSLDLRNGLDAYLIDINDLKQEEWFRKGEQANGKVVWGGIFKNYTNISDNKYVILLYRQILDINSGKNLGCSILFFRQKFFEDCYKGIPLENGEKFYLIDEEGNVLFSNQINLVASNIKNTEMFAKMLKDNSYFFEIDTDGKKSLIVHKISYKTGWRIIEVVPMFQIEEQLRIVANTTILLIVGTMLISGFLSFYLSGNFTRPIQILVRQVNEIAKGNFNYSITLNSSNEISELGKSITKMATDIQNLIHQSLRKEKEKREVEIKMLQNQINPHFLYNTLNSIKWMAAMQGAQGIKKMVGCLGRLLKAVLGDMNEKITLSEELDILEDYIHIQKIRYKGKVNFEKKLQDENLQRCLVPKFILQPIVENSIFHGIEPKNGTGNILLSVQKDGGDLKLEIWDDGVGISKEKITSILEKDNDSGSGRGIKGIGLSNIHQRIKLMYGEQYGLLFESIEDKYTKVTVRLPVVFCESEDDNIENIDC